MAKRKEEIVISLEALLVLKIPEMSVFIDVPQIIDERHRRNHRRWGSPPLFLFCWQLGTGLVDAE